VNERVVATLGGFDRQPLPRRPPLAHARWCEWRQFGGRRQRQDEQHTRNAMGHRRHPGHMNQGRRTLLYASDSSRSTSEKRQPGR
jgi:hypothetical protein